MDGGVVDVHVLGQVALDHHRAVGVAGGHIRRVRRIGEVGVALYAHIPFEVVAPRGERVEVHGEVVGSGGAGGGPRVGHYAPSAEAVGADYVAVHSAHDVVAGLCAVRVVAVGALRVPVVPEVGGGLTRRLSGDLPRRCMQAVDALGVVAVEVRERGVDILGGHIAVVAVQACPFLVLDKAVARVRAP